MLIYLDPTALFVNYSSRPKPNSSEKSRSLSHLDSRRLCILRISKQNVNFFVRAWQLYLYLEAKKGKSTLFCVKNTKSSMRWIWTATLAFRIKRFDLFANIFTIQFCSSVSTIWIHYWFSASASRIGYSFGIK